MVDTNRFRSAAAPVVVALLATLVSLTAPAARAQDGVGDYEEQRRRLREEYAAAGSAQEKAEIYERFRALEYRSAGTEDVEEDGKPCAPSRHDDDDYPDEFDPACYRDVDLSGWEDAIRFRPTDEVLLDVFGRGMEIHELDEAGGDISLDYYAVHVKRMPVVDGVEMDPKDLLDRMQRDMDSFIDTDLASCERSGAGDAERLAAGDTDLDYATAGVAYSISMYDAVADTGLEIERGTVVSSGIMTEYRHSWTVVGAKFVFSTFESERDGGHPVSGNREFGYVVHEDGSYTFYTRGADRTTGWIDQSAQTVVFESADRLWRTWQAGVVAEIEGAGGEATIGTTEARRHDWDEVRARHGD